MLRVRLHEGQRGCAIATRILSQWGGMGERGEERQRKKARLGLLLLLLFRKVEKLVQVTKCLYGHKQHSIDRPLGSSARCDVNSTPLHFFLTTFIRFLPKNKIGKQETVDQAGHHS